MWSEVECPDLPISILPLSRVRAPFAAFSLGYDENHTGKIRTVGTDGPKPPTQHGLCGRPRRAMLAGMARRGMCIPGLPCPRARWADWGRLSNHADKRGDTDHGQCDQVQAAPSGCAQAGAHVQRQRPERVGAGGQGRLGRPGQLAHQQEGQPLHRDRQDRRLRRHRASADSYWSWEIRWRDGRPPMTSNWTYIGEKGALDEALDAVLVLA